MKNRFCQLSIVAATLLLAGCIHQETTEVREVPRVKVEFENETAGRLFYEALSHFSGQYARQDTETNVNIPFLIHHRKKVSYGPNIAFNRGVELCDTNKDGKISEQEARIYLDTTGK
jgi:hypothetical protein